VPKPLLMGAARRSRVAIEALAAAGFRDLVATIRTLGAQIEARLGTATATA